MITGKLMFDIEIEVENEAELSKLSKLIEVTLKPLSGVLGVEEVDSDVNDDSADE